MRVQRQPPPSPEEKAEAGGHLDTQSQEKTGTMEETEEKVEADQRETEFGSRETEFESGDRGGRPVISDQPVGNGNEAVGRGPEALPSSEPRRFLGVQCCQGEPDPVTPGSAALEAEPNNNTNNAPVRLPPRTASPLYALPSSPFELEKDEKRNDVERADFLRDKLPAHNVAGSAEATEVAAAGRTETGKARGVRLKDRLFQFPLCEKALAFNIPTHNKTKVLPLAQYNCCHVL